MNTNHMLFMLALLFSMHVHCAESEISAAIKGGQVTDHGATHEVSLDDALDAQKNESRELRKQNELRGNAFSRCCCDCLDCVLFFCFMCIDDRYPLPH